LIIKLLLGGAFSSVNRDIRPLRHPSKQSTAKGRKPYAIESDTLAYYSQL
jgi:hypothetical protein